MEVSGPEYAQIFTARVSLGENGDIIGIGKAPASVRRSCGRRSGLEVTGLVQDAD